MARPRQSPQTFDNPPPCAIGQILHTALNLSTEFLENPASNLTTSRVHFELDKHPTSREPYITIIDNVLTVEECSTLIDAVRVRSETAWETIVGNDNGDGQGFLTDNRKCRRIMWDSSELATKVWNRMACAVPEVQRLSQWPEVTGPPESKPGRGEREVWRMVRLNERMRFMKYSCGDFFKPHYDCSYETPDHKQRSFFTLHLTLNGRDGLENGAEAFDGGDTTFYGPEGDCRVKVEPKPGRVLLFQHADLYHAVPSRLTCIRHAQGYHNITHDWDLPDPELSPHGEAQCTELATALATIPFDLVVCSPLRRAISTALLGLSSHIARAGPAIALPDTQETFDVPCDTGLDASVLKKEMEGKPMDLSRVEEDWNCKKGKWAPTIPEVEKRARDTRLWLQSRPEKEIVLVGHGGFLHYLTEDWTDFNEVSGTGWKNIEFRMYQFKPDDGDKASLIETTESQDRRRKAKASLDANERMALEGIAKTSSST